MNELVKKRKLREEILAGKSSVIVDEPTGAYFLDPARDIGWLTEMNPSDSQGKLPSCAAHALCNYLEFVLRQHNMPDLDKWQLDAHRVWTVALELAGRANTGLRIGELMRGAKIVGLLPDNAATTRVYHTNLFEALEKSPLLVATNITEDWPYANPHNGYIRPGGEKRAPHMTVLIGVSAIKHENGPFVHLMNSWGTDVGMDGVVTLPLDEFTRLYLEAWSVDFDKFHWAQNGEWEEFLI